MLMRGTNVGRLQYQVKYHRDYGQREQEMDPCSDFYGEPEGPKHR